MRIQTCVLFLTLCVIFPLQAQHAVYLPKPPETQVADWISMSLAVDSGLMCGMLYEYVFIDNENDGKFNDMLSRLDWQLNPLVYVGFSLDAELLNLFTLGLGGWLGIPSVLGYLEDRDWGTPMLGYTGNLEGFSHHTNFLYNAFFADINLGYNLIKTDPLVCIPLLGFNYKHFLMSGRDGYQEVPPGNLPTELSGELITYEQNYYIVYMGIKAFYSPLPWLGIQLFACYSPMVFGFNIDKHLHPSVRADYIDIPLWGQYVNVNLAALFRIMNDFMIKLQGEYMYVSQFQGDIYAKLIYQGSNDFVKITSSKGGASLYSINISLGCVFGISQLF
jgi:outer membrane protease